MDELPAEHETSPEEHARIGENKTTPRGATFSGNRARLTSGTSV